MRRPIDREKAARFQALIRGEFKEEFSRAVEAIVRRRLKNERGAAEELAAMREAQKELLERVREEIAARQAVRWEHELEEAREAYPMMDAEELFADEQFTALLTRPEHPLSVREAYEVLHFDELRAALAQEAAARARDEERARAARPIENGAAAQGGLPVSGRRMTRRERAELARRAQRGERISF